MLEGNRKDKEKLTFQVCNEEFFAFKTLFGGSGWVEHGLEWGFFWDRWLSPDSLQPMRRRMYSISGHREGGRAFQAKSQNRYF